MTLTVAVVEMISSRIVKIYGHLHQAKPENTCIKVDIPLRVAGNRRHVMQAFNIGQSSPPW